jgi:hypothetical protein
MPLIKSLPHFDGECGEQNTGTSIILAQLPGKVDMYLCGIICA